MLQVVHFTLDTKVFFMKHNDLQSRLLLVFLPPPSRPQIGMYVVMKPPRPVQAGWSFVHHFVHILFSACNILHSIGCAVDLIKSLSIITYIG